MTDAPRCLIIALVCAVCPASVTTSEAGDAFDRSITTSAAARRVDIVGTKLGMTPDEIRAAIAAHDPTLKIRVAESTVELADGTERSFVTAVSAERRGEDSDAIDVSFSQPPRDAQAVGIIRRKEFALATRPAYAPVRKALLEQYGRPSDEVIQGVTRGEAADLEGQGGGIKLKWRLDKDKAECAELRRARRAPRPSSLGGRKPAECSALLVVWMGVVKGLVTSVTAASSNPALSALAQVEYRAFRSAQLDGRRRRQAQKPDR